MSRKLCLTFSFTETLSSERASVFSIASAISSAGVFSLHEEREMLTSNVENIKRSESIFFIYQTAADRVLLPFLYRKETLSLVFPILVKVLGNVNGYVFAGSVNCKC